MTSNLQSSFRALADPTRREILIKLSARDMTIGEVADQFDICRSAVKKHLTILEEGQLISVHPKGRERLNRIEPKGLKTTADWFNYFDKFWDRSLNSLKKAIDYENRANTKGTKK